MVSKKVNNITNNFDFNQELPFSRSSNLVHNYSLYFYSFSSKFVTFILAFLANWWFVLDLQVSIQVVFGQPLGIAVQQSAGVATCEKITIGGSQGAADVTLSIATAVAAVQIAASKVSYLQQVSCIKERIQQSNYIFFVKFFNACLFIL